MPAEFLYHPRQGCKMDCEKLRFCEIANCDCEEIAISQLTQFIFLSASRNRNITQFDFLEGRNCEKLRKIAKLKAFVFKSENSKNAILDSQNL